MYQETMNQIHAVAAERLDLYRLAGKQSLTSTQLQRVREISDQLPLLWDRYRREYAGRNRASEAIEFRRAA